MTSIKIERSGRSLKGLVNDLTARLMAVGSRVKLRCRRGGLYGQVIAE